jgi:hypothetical protein
MDKQELYDRLNQILWMLEDHEVSEAKEELQNIINIISYGKS